MARTRRNCALNSIQTREEDPNLIFTNSNNNNATIFNGREDDEYIFRNRLNLFDNVKEKTRNYYNKIKSNKYLFRKSTKFKSLWLSIIILVCVPLICLLFEWEDKSTKQLDGNDFDLLKLHSLNGNQAPFGKNDISLLKISQKLNHLQEEMDSLMFEINLLGLPDISLIFKLKNMTQNIDYLKTEFAKNKNKRLENFNKIYKNILGDLKHWTETQSSTWSLFGFGQSRMNIRELIKEELYTFNADKTAQADFALETAGGKVLTERCSKSLEYTSNSPNLAIQSYIQPGSCWAFEGTKGVLSIKLAREIIPNGVSIEHIPQEISLTGKIDSAMNEFQVYAFKNEQSTEMLLLGEFAFDISTKQYLQYFPIHAKLDSPIGVIELRVMSNHGNEKYTCIYRVRVHGVLYQ